MEPQPPKLNKWLKWTAAASASAFAIGAIAIGGPQTAALALGIGAITLGGAAASGLIDPVEGLIRPAAQWAVGKVQNLIYGLRNMLSHLFSKKEAPDISLATPENNPQTQLQELQVAPIQPWQQRTSAAKQNTLGQQR